MSLSSRETSTVTMRCIHTLSKHGIFISYWFENSQPLYIAAFMFYFCYVYCCCDSAFIYYTYIHTYVSIAQTVRTHASAYITFQAQFYTKHFSPACNAQVDYQGEIFVYMHTCRWINCMYAYIHMNKGVHIVIITKINMRGCTEKFWFDRNVSIFLSKKFFVFLSFWDFSDTLFTWGRALVVSYVFVYR